MKQIILNSLLFIIFSLVACKQPKENPNLCKETLLKKDGINVQDCQCKRGFIYESNGIPINKAKENLNFIGYDCTQKVTEAFNNYGPYWKNWLIMTTNDSLNPFIDNGRLMISNISVDHVMLPWMVWYQRDCFIGLYGYRGDIPSSIDISGITNFRDYPLSPYRVYTKRVRVAEGNLMGGLIDSVVVDLRELGPGYGHTYSGEGLLFTYTWFRSDDDEQKHKILDANMCVLDKNDTSTSVENFKVTRRIPVIDLR